ncbi:MAG: M60 family metallopeptidase, partial [Bacteroidaceae bacterium]|nr:M60 family metallopeptidase [Bacteroidaceae bacterium]
MKKTVFLLFASLMLALGATAQDKVVALSSATASSYQSGEGADRAIDGSTNTIWHSSWGATPTTFPVTFTVTLKEPSLVDYVRYIPRQDGNSNGNWDQVYVAYCPTTTGNDYTNVGLFSLNGSGSSYDFILGVTCGKIRFTIQSGANGFASASEITAYTYDNSKQEAFAPYFTDKLCAELKPEITSSEGIEDADVKQLVDNLLTDAAAYKKFRVGEYEPYMTLATLQKRIGTKNQYNKYENPTGIYLKNGQSCVVVVDGIENDPVKLLIKNWYLNESSSSYSLRNGVNYITATSEGNVFVDYFTDNFENAPNVKVHFVNAPVQGYWDQETMTNADWVELLKGRSSSDHSIIITRSKHAQLAYPVSAWLKHCPTNVDSTLTLYQQVQWAERDILGLERYGRQTKNRQLFFATDYGFMAAGGEGSYCHYNSLGGIMAPDAAKFDFWGVGHEWGHNNQIPEGFHWSGCGEMSNNIYASWAQIHFTGHRNAAGKVTYLRLEDENSGIDEYSSTRGGRMQTYFEEGLRKGISWQLQDGPDYHGATPETKSVVGYDANGKYIGMVTTTSRNYDHFVKLVPFWQLNLWGTLAGKCPDIIPMVIESIRTTENYSSTYNTHGKKQVNWVKIACDSTKLDLLPFFEKAGILRPISAYIEDYSPGWIIIDDNMITELKNYVKEQGYPAYTEEINYINGHNYHIYRDNLTLETPEKLGEGCTLSGSRVKVMHDVVRNAVAFETYNALGEILRITMYGLASDDSHSYTQVLFPTGSDINDISAYIVAVGYDGTRTKIYETSENIPLNLLKKKLTQAKSALNASDPDGAKVGYYKPISIVSLQELVNEVQKAIDNEDTSVHSYEEWLQLLDAELAALAADEMAKIPLYEGSIYTLSNKERTALGHATAGLKVSTSLTPAESPEFHWAFVPTGVKNQYYIQHVSTGLYISVAPESGRIKAEATAVSGAIAFNLIDVDGGKFAIQHSNNANVYIASDASKNVVGTKEMSTNAQWNITLAIDNHSATIKAKLEMLIGKVASTFEELIAATEPELQFHADITVLDEQLPTYVVALQEAYDAAIKGMSEGYAYPADLYTVLKNAYDKVKKAYQKALSLPIATDDAMVTCYYLQCLDTETYAYCFEGSGRYNGTLRANELTNETDRSYWFFLRPGENEGEYYIYNWYTGKPAGTSGRYIYANGTVEPTVYSIAIAEESYGLIISTANGSWNVQSGDNGYVQFTTSPA